MMTTRELPREEWDRLQGTELEALAATGLETLTILVVEDAGEIVGCWGLVPVFHAEGIWVAPAHRGRGSVGRHLLRGMREAMRKRHLHGVWTGAILPAVATMITKCGGRALPAMFYLPRTPEE
jgi:ribosomal protein S18 acetylase RimI-like enzyme